MAKICILRANFYFEEIMKLLIVLFSIIMIEEALSSTWSDPTSVEVLSQVCGPEFVKGTKAKFPNGQIKWKCLYKDKLPDVYQTDIDNKCYDTHVEGQWYYASNHLHYKDCILAEELGPSYSTFVKTKCADGYFTDGRISHTDVIFPHKICYQSY